MRPLRLVEVQMDIVKRFPQLPEKVLRHMIEDMCRALPAPEPDTPENRERFREAAINEFIALEPFDIFDAMAAKSIIVCEALAWECSRNAARSGVELKLVAGWESLARNNLSLAQSMRRDIERRRTKRLKEAQKQAPPKKRNLSPLVLTATGVSFRDVPARQSLTKEQKAARIRALRLHLVEAPPTLH
jgi:hypothetical protein